MDIKNFDVHLVSYASVLHLLKGERIVGFEIWPIAQHADDEGNTNCEWLSDDETKAGIIPDMWGVYARIGKSQCTYTEAQCIADAINEQSAYALVEFLQKVLIFSGVELQWLIKPPPPPPPSPIIGWCYNKRGEQVPVYAPVNSNLQPIYPRGKTATGQIAEGVGNGGNKWDYYHITHTIARPVPNLNPYSLFCVRHEVKRRID